MIDQAFDSISRVLAIARFDIEQRQHINDYGLNIHAENYFRDIFRFIYEYNFENANFESQNVACIDLIDVKQKIAYQITTTRTKDKIEKILDFLQNLTFGLLHFVRNDGHCEEERRSNLKLCKKSNDELVIHSKEVY